MIFKKIKGEVVLNADMGEYTSFRTGGTVFALVKCEDLEDLKEVFDICDKYDKRMFILGAGSNILFSEGQHDIIVVQLTGKGFTDVSVDGNVVSAGAGVSLSELIRFSVSKGLKGIEAFAGIPASVGGALWMNAGHGQEICEVIDKVYVLDKKGNYQEIEKKDIGLSYRRCEIVDKIVVKVDLRLNDGDPQAIKKEYEKVIAKKQVTQPLDQPSAGCVFKNPNGAGLFAGRLIEECGLKGLVKGGAKISEKHANFIVNENHATADDIIFLINKIKEVVKQKKDIDLEEEIIIV